MNSSVYESRGCAGSRYWREVETGLNYRDAKKRARELNQRTADRRGESLRQFTANGILQEGFYSSAKSGGIK